MDAWEKLGPLCFDQGVFEKLLWLRKITISSSLLRSGAAEVHGLAQKLPILLDLVLMQKDLKNNFVLIELIHARLRSNI